MILLFRDISDVFCLASLFVSSNCSLCVFSFTVKKLLCNFSSLYILRLLKIVGHRRITWRGPSYNSLASNFLMNKLYLTNIRQAKHLSSKHFLQTRIFVTPPNFCRFFPTKFSSGKVSPEDALKSFCLIYL